MLACLIAASQVSGPTGGGQTYTNTAFVDPNAGGFPVLNDPAKAFNTVSAAVDALALEFSGQATTLRLLADLSDPAFTDLNPGEWDSLLTNGLTIMSNGGTTRAINADISFGTQLNANLTLVNVHLVSLAKAPHEGFVSENAGTLTGDAQTTIDSLYLNADSTPGSSGVNGSDGSSVSGGNGSDGLDGAPPADGTSGGSAESDGSPGSSGGDGNTAWKVTLMGSFTVGYLYGYGGPGGNGGEGGNGGSAIGGNGGNGGNGEDDGNGDPCNGGNGGIGGDATANGNQGGDGGNGGNAATVNYQSTVVLTNPFGSGGTGGFGGSGGEAGNAIGGTGGAAGSGFNGGLQGSFGSNGNSIQNTGEQGANGSSGADLNLISF